MILSKNRYENIISAPIAGYTNWPLRRIFARYNAYRIFSEMVHVREIFHKEFFEFPFLNINYRFTIQLFGSFEDDFNLAIEKVKKYCDNIDINCGCPAKKVIKAGGGSFWLKDIDRFSKKIYQISESYPNKISVKIRLGFSKPQINEILDSIKDAKLAFITIHMRTADMLFSGKALYQYAEILNNYKLPIVLNGDITDPIFAKNILDSYNCSGIMIGRAALSDPSIFQRIKEYINEGKIKKTCINNKIDNCILYIDNLLLYFKIFSLALEKNNLDNFQFHEDSLKTDNNFEIIDDNFEIVKKVDDQSIKKFIRSNIVESRKILFALSKKIPFSNKLKENILKINSIDELKELKNYLISLKND
ncbi:MAG TPA: tRNA-dihydrouridine synthase family protein [Exilispira sp.]|mgnify:CR=1 FL=1|nr:tRNA-dihydrouridine synthase family protein [Exilispira sp.]